MASLLVFLRLKTWGAERYFRPRPETWGGAIALAAPRLLRLWPSL